MVRAKPQAIDRAVALRYMGASGWQPDDASSALLDRAESRLLQTAVPRTAWKKLPRTSLPLKDCGNDLMRHLQGCEEVLVLVIDRHRHGGHCGCNGFCDAGTGM